MQIKEGFFNKGYVNIGVPGDNNLPLKRGEVVLGLVQAVKDKGLVQVSLKGMSIEARTDLQVQPGQQMYLYVDDFREGRTYLRVISTEVVQNLETNRLANILLGMGIKAEASAVEAARKLIQYQLPVTRENITLLLKAAALLGEANPTNLEVAAFTVSRGGTVAENSLQALREFFSLPRNVVTLLGEALLGLDGIEKEATPTSLNMGRTDSELFLGEGKLNGPAANTSPTGRELFGSQVGATESGLSLPLTRSLPLMEGVLKLLVALMDIETGTPPNHLANRMRELVQSEAEIIRTLAFLREVIGKKLPEPQSQALISPIQAAESGLAGQRIFNGLENMRHEHNQFLYFFAIPLKVNGEECLCQLKVSREPGEKDTKGEGRDTSLAVSLETLNLGMVVFHVTFQPEGHLHLRGAVEEASTRDYLEKNMPYLTTALSKLGFMVFDHGIKLAGKKELDIRPHLESTRHQVRPLGIDIRV